VLLAAHAAGGAREDAVARIILAAREETIVWERRRAHTREEAEAETRTEQMTHQ
jgi:hypothetical protein